MRGSIWPFQFGLPRDIKLAEAKTTKDQTIQKRTEPAFIEPMQCKPVTALPTGEKWTFEIKRPRLRIRCAVPPARPVLRARIPFRVANEPAQVHPEYHSEQAPAMFSLGAHALDGNQFRSSVL